MSQASLETGTRGVVTPPASVGRGSWIARCKPFGLFCRKVLADFWRHRCQVRASALAYTTLLALVPLLAVSLAVVGMVLDVKKEGQPEKLTKHIEEIVHNIAPTLGLTDASADGAAGASQRAKVAAQLLEFVDKIHFGTIGVTAMAGLIFVAISLLRTIEAAFNDIWEVHRGRGWFHSVILYWAVITLGPIIIVVAGTSGYLSTLDSGRAFLEKWLPSGLTVRMASLVPLLLLTVGFAALYRLIPNTHVDWRAALVGGAVAALLWWGNNKLGALYNSKVVTYSKIYGSLGAVPLFLAGLYMSWLILLFGAQTAHSFQFRSTDAERESASRLDPRAREESAVRLVNHLARRFASHEEPATREELSRLLGIPPGIVGEHLERLCKAGFLLETQGRQPRFAVARPLDSIRVADVLRAIRENDPHAKTRPARSPADAVTEIFERYEKAGFDSATVTFADVVRGSNQTAEKRANMTRKPGSASPTEA